MHRQNQKDVLQGIIFYSIWIIIFIADENLTSGLVSLLLSLGLLTKRNPDIKVHSKMNDQPTRMSVYQDAISAWTNYLDTCMLNSPKNSKKNKTKIKKL